MIRRLIDIVFSSVVLVLVSPLLAVTAIGIWISDPGPILFHAERVGINGRVFSLYKFRTMRNQSSCSNLITVKNDPRVFGFGSWLRRLKIDELPQLVNVLKGEMSVVGPRPENSQIVGKYYLSHHLETLSILPGLASPGSIYNYTHGEQLLTGDEAERYYGERLLPIKLALDTIYVREASFVYDVKIVLRVIWVILCITVGKTQFPDPPELRKAIQMGQLSQKPNC